MDQFERDVDKDCTNHGFGSLERSLRYIENTKERDVKKGVRCLVREIEPGEALELGPGAGIETVYLLKNDWKVTCVDINNVSRDEISKHISEEEKKRLSFIKSEFEDVKLPKEKYDIAIGFDSLFFCSKEHFNDFFREITSSIKPGGILLCTLLGVKDEWNREGSIYPFFTREQIIELFKRDYEFDENNTNEFREIENDSFKADKKTMKHWHSFLIKAKKK